MANVVVVLVLAGLVALWIFALIALISIVRLPDHAWRISQRSKSWTFLAVVLTGGFGALLYWFKIKPVVKAAAQHSPLPPKTDAWSDSGGW